MNSLREMNERRETWLAEKPQFTAGPDLRLQTNDLVLFKFVASGDDGDRFVKIYRAHMYEGISPRGTRFGDPRYCPIQSGEAGVECPFCAAGHTDIKERFSAWMAVSNIFHTTQPTYIKEPMPVVQYEGRNYFNEEIKAFKVWHTSAWKDSPWTDIVKLGEMFKGLNNFTAQLLVVGEMLTRRYKVYGLPNSPGIPPELYEVAKTECQPIMDMLHGQLTSPVQANPQAAPTQQPAVQASPFAAAPASIFAVPGAPVQVFTVPGADSAAPAAGSVFATEQPIVTAAPDEDPRFPLKSLF